MHQNLLWSQGQARKLNNDWIIFPLNIMIANYSATVQFHYIIACLQVSNWISQCSTPHPYYGQCACRWSSTHDDVIKWKHFPRNCPFVLGIHWSLVNSRHKGQRRGALMFSLICDWTNGWENSREAGDLRLYHAHHIIVMTFWCLAISRPSDDHNLWSSQTLHTFY